MILALQPLKTLAYEVTNSNGTKSIFDFPVAVQEEVTELVQIFRAMDHHRKKDFRDYEDSSREGWSAESLWRKYKLWEKSGFNNVALIDKRRFPELWEDDEKNSESLPEEFLSFVAGQFLANQRANRPAYRVILERWREWRRTGSDQFAIPGYDKPPRDCGKGHPAGWSYRNLCDRVKLPDEEKALSRIGSAAAAQYLPHIHNTREGVRFLEYVYFDDVWQDRKCIVPGIIDPVRLLQLGCMDYASTLYAKFGVRPDIMRDDKTRQRLQRRDVLWLVASLLLEYGYPLDYPMHLIMERGTATMNKAEAMWLYTITEGQVRVGYSTMEGQFVLAWEESKTGNPNAKPNEWWHNLFHNELAGLPGQVGKDRDHSPKTLAASDREAANLNKLALILTSDQRRNLNLPYPSLAEAHEQTEGVVRRINNRRDHRIEDFKRVTLWRIKGTDMEWRPEAELATLQGIPHTALDFLSVMETPWERFARLSQGVRMARPHPGSLLKLYEDAHTLATIQQREAMITLNGKRIFFGPENDKESLQNDTEVELHHDPINPQYAIVTIKGCYKGLWKRQLSRKSDGKALAEGIQRKKSFLNETAANVRGKMLETLIEQDRRINGNLANLEEAGVLPSGGAENLSHGGEIVVTDVTRAVEQTAKEIANAKSQEEQDADLHRRAVDSISKSNSTTTPQEDNNYADY